MRLSRKAAVCGTLTELFFFLFLWIGLRACSWPGNAGSTADSFWALTCLFLGFAGHLPAALFATLLPTLDRGVAIVFIALIQFGTWILLWYLWLKRR